MADSSVLMLVEIGAQLGDYRLLSRIGKGSYGIVYEAEHAITRRIDALKLMLYAGPYGGDDEQRFLREIRVQASLQHPNIAAVYNAFRTEYGPALVMELVRGESLRPILNRGRVPVEEGVDYVRAALRGLACAEKLGIVHRDIKPENILIAPGGTVKLTDFGLAHVVNGANLTGSGENIGTPVYMSPEQVVGNEPVDARTDVYSAGVVLYEVVTGKPPFQGSNGFAVMLAHRNTPPVPPIELNPAIGERLNRVILTALEKEPARRFTGSAEFEKALEEAMADSAKGPVRVPVAVIRRAAAPWPKYAGAAAIGLASCGLLLVAGRVAVLHSATARATAARSAAKAAPKPAPPPPAAAPVPEPIAAPAPPVIAPAAPASEAATPTSVPAGRHSRVHKPAIASAKPAAAPSTLPRVTSPDPGNSGSPLPLHQTAIIPAQAAPITQSKPPVTPVESMAAPPDDAPPPAPAASAATPQPSPAKHHNAVIRALGKLFGKHGNANPPDAVSK